MPRHALFTEGSTGGKHRLTTEPGPGGQHMFYGYLASILEDSPLLIWPLGETSGTVAGDISGNGHPGTYVNGPTLGAAGSPPGGLSMQHDGVNDAVTTTIGTLATVEMWAYLPSTITPSSSPYGLWWLTHAGLVPRQGVFIGGSATLDVTNEVLTYIQSDGTIQQSVGYCGAMVTIDPGWHQIVTTYSSVAGRTTLYLDGVRVDNQSLNGGIPVGGVSLCVGGYQPGSNPYIAGGRMAWFSCYDHELSASRIAAHYDSAFP